MSSPPPQLLRIVEVHQNWNLRSSENIAIDEMLASTKKPKATPLMEKFYNSIEYFEEVVQVDADSIPGSSEETKADRRDHQTKFYWRGHCKLPHTTAEVTGIIADKMGTSSNFSRHVKNSICRNTRSGNSR